MNKLLLQLCFPIILFGQGSLLDELEVPEQKTHPVTDIFKGTRVVNLQSVEMVHPNILQFMVSHRFGAINDGFYTLFGLDEAEIRFDFQYGYSDRITLGVGRDSFEKTYEVFSKIKIKDQLAGKNSFPMAIVFYSAMFINTEETGPTMDSYYNNRLSFVNQFIFGRKLSKSLSVEIAPTFVHRNFVLTQMDIHDTYAVGIGAKNAINPWVTINMDYCFRLGSFSTQYNNSLSIGLDIETGGHIFQIHVTNSQGMFERSFISETSGNWSKGEVYFGFNLSRPFQMK